MVAPALGADFADKLRAVRRGVSILGEANCAIQDCRDRATRPAGFAPGLDRSVSIENITVPVFEEVRGILSQDVMLLALVDSDGQEFRPIAAEPADKAAGAQRELEAQCASGVVARAIGRRRPTVVPAVHLDGNVVVVPLATARGTVGVLMMGTPLAAASIAQQHLTLAAVARRAMKCIENFRLVEDLRPRTKAGRPAAETVATRPAADRGLPIETAGVLSAEWKRDAALRFLVEATRRHLGATAAIISITEPDGRLATAYSAGFPGTRVDLPRCGGDARCPLVWVVDHGSPLTIAGIRQDANAWGCAILEAVGAISFLGVPLAIHGRTIGVLSVMTDTVREFTAEEIALLTGLAAQGAEAMEKARLVANAQGRMEQQRPVLARLVQSAHLASVGSLAGGLAHDINNSLCIISNHLQLLRLKIGALPPDANNALMAIETSVSRIAGSVETLLEYARVRPGARQPSDLNETTRRILFLLKYHPLCRRPTVETVWGEDLPAIDLDPAAWGQVVLELITNASEAMAEGGRVRIMTRPLGRRLCADGSSVPWVEAIVEDEGPGIAPEEVARIFDPFFTTKDAKHGMGIGLWLCRDIVRSHGGVLRIESGSPRGTRVVIELPGVPKTRQVRQLDNAETGAGTCHGSGRTGER